jgi:hypothetical protein
VVRIGARRIAIGLWEQQARLHQNVWSSRFRIDGQKLFAIRTFNMAEHLMGQNSKESSYAVEFLSIHPIFGRRNNRKHDNVFHLSTKDFAYMQPKAKNKHTTTSTCTNNKPDNGQQLLKSHQSQQRI